MGDAPLILAKSLLSMEEALIGKLPLRESIAVKIGDSLAV